MFKEMIGLYDAAYMLELQNNNAEGAAEKAFSSTFEDFKDHIQSNMEDYHDFMEALELWKDAFHKKFFNLCDEQYLIVRQQICGFEENWIVQGKYQDSNFPIWVNDPQANIGGWEEISWDQLESCFIKVPEHVFLVYVDMQQRGMDSTDFIEQMVEIYTADERGNL